MDRNRQLLDEMLATIDDPERVELIERAWEEIEVHVANLAAMGIKVTIGYDRNAERFIMQSTSRIEH